MTPDFGPDEKTHSVDEATMVPRTRKAEGVDIRDDLATPQRSEEETSRPRAPVWLNQIIEGFQKTE
jgi:hypothetical protein